MNSVYIKILLSQLAAVLSLVPICYCQGDGSVSSGKTPVPFIFQISPEISVEHFLSIYPSLTYKLLGQVKLGGFQAIYGDFDARVARYLSFSSLVSKMIRRVPVTMNPPFSFLSIQC